MKITLKKDVLISGQEVGTIGQVIEMDEQRAKDFVRAGLADEAATDATADVDTTAPEDAAPIEPLNTSKLKEDKAAKDRKTKLDGPDATK